MAKSPGAGRCVHCLKEFPSRTWDHVFPKSWYPETTPPNLEKWQIPSCVKCNKEYGRLEEDLLIRIGLTLDPTDERSRGIVDKALRAINPHHGRNARDRSRREARKRKLFRELLLGTKIPNEGRYPGLDRTWGQEPHELIGIPISPEHIDRLAKKVVRGIFYIEDELFIEPPYQIEFLALDDDGATPLRELLDRFGSEYAREPGIVVQRAVIPDDNISSVFEIDIWGQFKMFAFVLAASEDAEGD